MYHAHTRARVFYVQLQVYTRFKIIVFRTIVRFFGFTFDAIFNQLRRIDQ